MNPLWRIVATAGFSGYAPIAPGTAGSAVALAIYLLLPPLSPLLWTALIAGVSILAVPAAAAGEREWGKDPGPVVIDEVAGFFVTVAFLPQTVTVGVLAFFVFRALDIAKPFPVRQAEGLPGGWGVVADDVLAGAYGNLAVRGLLAGAAALGF